MLSCVHFTRYVMKGEDEELFISSIKCESRTYCPVYKLSKGDKENEYV